MTDISEILKKYPSGTKLYSPICGECYLYWVVDEVKVNGAKVDGEIVVYDNNRSKYSFYKDGTQHPMGECLLFPSKNCRDWDAMRVTQNCNKENNNTKNSKEENRQKFKKGDFLKDEFGNIFICKEAHKTCWENEYLGVAFCVLFNNMMFADKDWIWRSCLVSYATEEEKQKLLKVIDEKGYIWDDEKLELRKKEPEFKDMAEETAGKGLDESEYLARLQKFYQENCKTCGSQRCLGVYDEDWREGCKLYREEFCNDVEINHAEPKCKMNTEAVSENKNVSPLLYGSIDSKQRETLLKRLEELYNNLGIDTEFSTPDYLLAEYTLNCLVSYGNTVAKNIEKGYIKPTLL